MSSETTILQGAEAYSARGDRRGALVIHGFTGCPQSMRPLAEAFAAAGFTVELPRLPGHGTTPEDMAKYQWRDWTAAVDAAYRNLASRTDKIVVAGLSMGGTLTLWTAERHPETAAIVVINGACEDQDINGLAEAADQALASGQSFLQGVAGDVADPNSKELGYDRVPVATVRPLMEGVAEVKAKLGEIKCPVLILHSPQDHVVGPGSVKAMREGIKAPIEYVALEKSFHVATIDFDREKINGRAVAFAKRFVG
jgi:carboxylesterase